ncbi:hypothetical protein [Kribbella lupini]|uniref:HNH endonuclease n=1 Tax=Kribbella lupini TaxID=291602 RepID=A0ABP4NEE7_9ACTN
MVLERGVPVCVGEVAHIVGARSSGPRGDEDVEDRDAFDNLLLLCGRHHKVIDAPQSQDLYPVALLRGWKRDRERDVDPAGRAEFDQLTDLPRQLPALLAEAHRDVTAALQATIDRLGEANHLSLDMVELLHLVLTRSDRSGPQVGEGVPGIKEVFESAYDAAGGASFLGLPSSEAFAIGAGVVQRLRGGRCGHPALLCARFGSTALITTADLWEGIAAVGEHATGGGILGVGYPNISGEGDPPYVGPDVEQVRTSGGTWGKGAMTRDASGNWRWTPDLRFDSNSAGNMDVAFGSQARLDLRLRLVAEFPGDGSDLRVTAAGRRQLSAALASPGTSELLAALAAGRLEPVGRTTWQPKAGPYARNDSGGASYECTVEAADGRTAIRGTAQYLMPHLMMGTVTSIVDLEIDFNQCQPEPCRSGTAVGRPVSLTEVVDFFTMAWRIAFETLPLAAGDTLDSRELGGSPRVSLNLLSERPPGTGGDRNFGLADLVDLAPLGRTHRNNVSQLGIAVLGRGPMPPAEIRDVVKQAIIRMSEDVGFDRADLIEW